MLHVGVTVADIRKDHSDFVFGVRQFQQKFLDISEDCGA
jgi:hypothetical protein